MTLYQICNSWFNIIHYILFMEHFKINKSNIVIGAKKAAKVLASGGIVLFPSDTVYGLAVDPTQKTAVQALHALKKRDADTKKLSCIFASIDHIAQWAILSDSVRVILENHLPGPFTFIVPSLQNNKVSIGVRIPNYLLTTRLACAFGSPYTATSANVSGKPPTHSVDEFLSQIKAGGVHIRPNLVLDIGTLPLSPPSTIVDLTGEKPVVVRKGAGTFES
jgi:L-threonylcarbamoyladenylate synthase